MVVSLIAGSFWACRDHKPQKLPSMPLQFIINAPAGLTCTSHVACLWNLRVHIALSPSTGMLLPCSQANAQAFKPMYVPAAVSKGNLKTGVQRQVFSYMSCRRPAEGPSEPCSSLLQLQTLEFWNVPAACLHHRSVADTELEHKSVSIVHYQLRVPYGQLPSPCHNVLGEPWSKVKLTSPRWRCRRQ